MKYLKSFNTYAEYQAYINGSNKILPNVSYCKDNNEVYFNPYEPPSRVVTAVFNIQTIANPVSITYENGWEDVESVLVTSPNETTFELAYEDLVEYDSIEGIDPYMAYQFGTTGNYTFEYTLKPNVTEIGVDFVTVPYLISIVIPNSITTIGEHAFGGTGLTSIIIPNNVTTIGDYAFDYCIGLTSVEMGNSVTSIGEGAFQRCTSLTSITIPDSVTSIDSTAFYNCSNLTNIVSNATTAPIITNDTFRDISTGGILTVPIGSTGYDTWLETSNYYLGKYNWTKVEQ